MCAQGLGQEQSDDAESELVRLLVQLVPTAANETRGAPEEEIVQIERLAGRALPGFYKWFLRNMGTAMGPYGYPRMDCSASTILGCYQKDLVPPNKQFLLIGYSTDPMVPLHIFYDLDRPVRDDACVVEADDLEGTIEAKFETFREMIAWGNFLEHKILLRPVYCRGLLKQDDANVLPQLHPLLEQYGLISPILRGTGSYCTLLDSD